MEEFSAIKEWFANWAEDTEVDLDLVICRELQEVQHQDETCFCSKRLIIHIVSQLAVSAVLFNEIQEKIPNMFCLALFDENKVFTDASNDGRTRVELAVKCSISDAKSLPLIWTTKVENISVLFQKCSVNNSLDDFVERKQETTVTECIRLQALAFMVALEVASNKRACGDKFQFLFQLQLAYFDLVKLEFIRQEGHNFLYLPKMVFSHFSEHQRHMFEVVLEPRSSLNTGHVLLQKYLAKFTSILSDINSTFADFEDAESLKTMCSNLTHVLRRNQPFYSFQSGRPAEICRPFHHEELLQMRHEMLLNVPTLQAHPIAVIITGLPGCGKTTACKQVLETVLAGAQLNDFANIDMDITRAFHGQYQALSHKLPDSMNNMLNTLHSHEELVPWFNEGTDIEKELYKRPDGVVKTLLAQRSHFVLATVMDTQGTLDFIKYCVKQGYHPVLIDVHVTAETSICRAQLRAKITGRFMPEQVIRDREPDVRTMFNAAAKYVAGVGGVVKLYDNEPECTDVPTLPLEEVLSCVDGVVTINHPDIAALYVHDFEANDTVSHNSPPQEPSALNSVEDLSAVYQTDGFVAMRGCIDSSVVSGMGDRFERAIDSFAADNDTTRSEYLSVINKWPHCNSSVLGIMTAISSALGPQVAQVLGSESAWPVGAVMFRKTSSAAEAGNATTHAHQDISYARFPGSQMFRATTWVPLLMHNADTLCFAKGSHKHGIADVEDFLQVNASAQLAADDGVDKGHQHVSCGDVVNVTLGDCILFDARVWHGSTPFPAVTDGSGSLRLAIGIQWLTPGGLDGLSPGVYFRWPESDIPRHINLGALRDRKVFGMDTAGHFLKLALVKLDETTVEGAGTFGTGCVGRESFRPLEKQSTLALARKFSKQDDLLVAAKLKQMGCDVERAQSALMRYVLFRQAARKHFGEAQGTKIFTPIYDHFIKYVLNEEGR